MKNLYRLMLVAAILTMTGCKKVSNRAQGTLTINLSADSNPNLLKTKSGVDPSTFSLEVWRGSTLAASFAPIGSGTKTVALDAASYTISAFSNRFTSPKFEMPVYGETQMATIDEGENKTVTLNCAQINSGVVVVYSDAFKASHTNYSVTITQPEGDLTYGATETRRGYFLSKSADLNIVADGYEYKKSLTLVPQTDYDIEIERIQTGTKGELSIIINVITEVKREVIKIDIPDSNSPLPSPPGEAIDYYETLGTTMSNSTVAAYTDWSYPAATYSGSGVTIKSDNESDNPGASGFDYLYFAAGSRLDISGINTLNESVSSVSLSFGCGKRSGTFVADEFRVSVSSDGIVYNDLSYTRSEETTWEEVIISSGIPHTRNLRLRFQCSTSFYYLDDIKLTPQ